jgi:DNA-binding NtrC family response regulator
MQEVHREGFMIKLLIVANSQAEIKFLTSALSEIELIACNSTAEAMETLVHTKVDVAIVPWRGGTEVVPTNPLLQIKRVFPSLPVLVIDDTLDLSKASRALSLGAADFLLEPVDKERLKRAVRRALLGPDLDSLVQHLRSVIIGDSPSIINLLEELARVITRSNSPTLIVGDTGTGKELIARAVHEFGVRSTEPWVAMNIASFPATLLESELFGHEKGAFTNAQDRRIGAFELSGAGTIFLDEIGELDLPLQAKLLRVLQEKKFQRVGGNMQLSFSARLVCATNQNLISKVRTGQFREDLYHRINSHELRIPTLRERGNDVQLLADYFLKKHSSGKVPRFSRESRSILGQYKFPGNVRELENLVLHCLSEIQNGDDEVLPYHLPVMIMTERTSASDLEETSTNVICYPANFFEIAHRDALSELQCRFDREYLPKKLEAANGNITRAAQTAGLDPKTFRKHWKEAGLPPLEQRKS